MLKLRFGVQSGLVVAGLLISIKAVSWGPVGHRTVGLIAHSQLSPQAKVGVSKLIGKQNLADVANWADEIKGTNTFKQASWYHFEKLADDVFFLDHFQELSADDQRKGGVVTSILYAQLQLRARNTSLQEQAIALKFLTHFVGDIHQPLHSGRPEDKGGNTIQVRWFGKPMSLHRVWDSGLIETGHADIIGSRDSVEKASQTYGRYLSQKFYNGQKPSDPVQSSEGVENWLNEAMDLRKGAYEPLYLKKQMEYQSLHLPEVDLAVYNSGVRLALVLNSLFAADPISKPDRDLIQSLEDLVGDLGRLISFQP